MYSWRFELLRGRTDFDDKLLKTIHQIFLDGFALENGWSIEGIKKTLSRSTALGLARGDDDQLVGYAIYTIPDTPLEGTDVLWEEAVCVRTSVQSGGLGTRSLKDVLALFPDRKFGWIGGRTQNPLVMRRYAKFGKLFPFDTAYSDPEGQLVMNYLLQRIAEVYQVPEENFVKSNGICRKVYKEGQLGKYPLDVPGTENYEKLLQEWDFNRKEGDAVIVVSKLAI